MSRTRLVFAVLLSVAGAALGAAYSASAAQARLPTALRGNALLINGNPTRLGAAQWAEPERSWRTLGELLKSAVPPADKTGQRPHVTLVVGLDNQAPWGALKALLMAASGLGMAQARINLPGKPDDHAILPLPGADPKKGAVVELPLFSGKGAQSARVFTENNGKRRLVSAKLLQGLVKQLPHATVHVRAPNALRAVKVVGILRLLHRDAKAKAVAFLPVQEISAREQAERKKAKRAVDRAFEGGLGGLGK